MTYRVYYNRALDYPQVWSVDEGTPASEVNVVGFFIDGCRATSKAITGEPGRALDVPCAWIEVDGTLTLDRGVAVFR